MKSLQKYAAEFLGTFILVLVGTTGVIAAVRLTSGAPAAITVEVAEIVVPLGFGLALLAGLYAFASVSGGHFNPAVSLGLFLDGRLSAPDLVGYWFAQFVGAIAASALLLVPFNKGEVAATTTHPGAGISDGGAFLLEAVFTAIFVLVILESTKRDRYAGTTLLAIPLTLVTIHVALISATGASVNPARTLGPALIGDHWDSEWIYFLGPALGAIVAWLVYQFVVVKGTEEQPAPSA